MRYDERVESKGETQMSNLDKFIQKEFKMTTKELVEKMSKRIIKNGSDIIKKTKEYELVGVRNSRDKKWFLKLMFDSNATSQSVNYDMITIAKGAY